MSGVPVTVCNACDWRGFLARFWCPACGSTDLRTALVHGGHVEDLTILHRAAGRTIGAPVRNANEIPSGSSHRRRTS